MTESVVLGKELIAFLTGGPDECRALLAITVTDPVSAVKDVVPQPFLTLIGDFGDVTFLHAKMRIGDELAEARQAQGGHEMATAPRTFDARFEGHPAAVRIKMPVEEDLVWAQRTLESETAAQRPPHHALEPGIGQTISLGHRSVVIGMRFFFNLVEDDTTRQAVTRSALFLDQRFDSATREFQCGKFRLERRRRA